MTPEERAEDVDIYGGSYLGPSVRENVAAAIRSAENEILDQAAAQVIKLLWKSAGASRRRPDLTPETIRDTTCRNSKS